MKLQNPALINPELFNRVEEIRMQKTFITIAVASVLFMVMTVIAS